MRVGLDVGGTKTDAVAVDEHGSVTARVRLSTGWGPAGVVQTVVDAVDALRRERGVDTARLLSVGVGMPGQVASGSAHVTHAVNLGIFDLDLARAVEPTLGAPVTVENDVKAAALGAYALRGGRRLGGTRPGIGAGAVADADGHAPAATMAYLNLGTGIAAGIVRSGRLWRGDHGTAGEIGHISVDPNGPLCGCGQHGCVEALAGGGRIARRWGRPAPFPVTDVLDAAADGDPRAAAIRADLMRGVAAAVRILVLTVDADVVVLGGGLTALGDRLMNGVVAELQASAAASAFMRSLRLPERLRMLPPGSVAAALGAALVGAAEHNEHNAEEAAVNG